MAVITLTNPTPATAAAPVFPDNAFAITPAAADTYSHPVTVFVGGAGNVTVIPWGGSTAVQYTVPAGGTIPVRVKAVTAATASALVGSY
jgi:hypothetical protein